MLDVSNADEKLTELRKTFGLHEHLPEIGTVHPVAVALGSNPETAHDDSTFMLCCHDAANNKSHLIAYPSSQVNEQNPGESRRVHGHVSRIIAAAYN